MKTVYMFLATSLVHIYISSTELVSIPIAQILQGLLLLVILIYNCYSLSKQKMPRSLFVALSMAILVMMSLLFVGTILVLLHVTVATSDPTLMLIDKIVQQIEQAFFFGILFQIDCEVLRLFSVLNSKITDNRINLLRNIWLPIYFIGCIFIFAAYWGFIPANLASPLALIFGGPVLIFDVIVSIYMLYKLVRLKRASVETPHVTEAICILSMMVFMVLFAIYLQSKNGRMLGTLNDTEYVCLTVGIAVLFSLQYGLAIELFTHIRILAISKASTFTEGGEQSSSKQISSPALLLSGKENNGSKGKSLQ